MKLNIDRDLSRLDDKKLSKRRIVYCEYHDEPLNRHGECETCAASEEKAKVEFADPGGSGKPDSHRMLEVWKLKRGGL